MKWQSGLDYYHTWLYAERYLGLGTRTYSPFSNDSDGLAKYHPLKGEDTFELPTFIVPYDKGHVLRQDFGHDLQDLYFHKNGFLLPVHPDILGEDIYMMPWIRQASPGPLLTVTPTASLRTVFVHAHENRSIKPHFLKLHYPRRISRFKRRLRQKIIELQLWVSQELYKSHAPHLKEVGAGLVGEDPVESWGYIIRDAALPHKAFKPVATVPFFALYGKDVHAPHDPSLLAQLIHYNGSEPLDFLRYQVLEPLLRLWLTTTAETGCILETHGQNTLLSFDAKGQTAITYRDCDVYVSPVLRKRAAKSLDYPAKNIIGEDIKPPLDQMLSLIYDSYLGHHMLAYIAQEMKTLYSVSESEIQGMAKAIFNEYAGSLASLFPTEEYYYIDRILDNNDWRLQVSQKQAHWR